MTDQNKAALAPSSLAGGEVHEAVALEVRMAMQDEMMASDANGGRVSQRIARANRAADTILAALSPEAPAREDWELNVSARAIKAILHGVADVEGGVWSFDHDMLVKASKRIAALTPRHEAPAEGAGEDADRLMQEFYLSRDYDPKAARPADTVKAAIAFALRARSSAPEARS